METVRLKCVKVDGKLRVRIISPGYLNNANCQFPKDIRLENRIYEVNFNQVTLVTRTNKNYYNVKKGHIKFIDEIEHLLEKLKVFEDTSSDDCAICMSFEKCMVIVPCGHYYTCEECTKKIKTCPICRIPFKISINKSEIV